jgi:FkbM family methyltransferase
VQKKSPSNNFKILKKIFNQNNQLTIFDVGANEGRFVEKALNCFNRATIHAFEPSEKEFSILQDKYTKKEGVILNNCALGGTKEQKYFNITYKGGLNSFYDVHEDTKWFLRQQNSKTFDKNFYIKKIKLDIETIDNYAKNIDSIDILKIDTQGSEPEVLEGSVKSLASKKIKAILLEIIISDIYKTNINFFEIEKNLINNGYKLVSLDNHGNIFDMTIFQLNAIYLQKSLI